MDSAVGQSKNINKQLDDSIKQIGIEKEELENNLSAETASKTDESGKKAKRIASAGFRLAEEIERKAELADIAGEQALAAATKVSVLWLTVLKKQDRKQSNRPQRLSKHPKKHERKQNKRSCRVMKR